MVCSAWGFIFIFSGILRKSIQALTAHFLTQLLNLFTTSAALSHIFTQSDSQTFSLLKVPSHYQHAWRRNPMLNNIPNTIVLSYRLQQCAEINERRNTDSINHIVQLSLLSVLSFCLCMCAAERKSHAVECVCASTYVYQLSVFVSLFL